MKIRTDAISVFKFLGYSNDSPFQQLETILRFKFRHVQFNSCSFISISSLGCRHCIVWCWCNCFVPMISNFANSSELFVNYLVELNVYMFSFGCERCGDSKNERIVHNMSLESKWSFP